MMHDKRGFLVALFGLTLSLSAGCEGDDATDGNDFGEREEADGGDIGSTTENTSCSRHQKASDCMDDFGCAPVYGHELFDDGNIGWCSDPDLRFLACMDTPALCTEPNKLDCEVLCPGIEQTVCIGDEFWRVRGCVPDNADICTAPGELTGECGTTL